MTASNVSSDKPDTLVTLLPEGSARYGNLPTLPMCLKIEDTAKGMVSLRGPIRGIVL